MEKKHTPGPWVVSPLNPLMFSQVRSDGQSPLGFIYGPAMPEDSPYGRRKLADCQLVSAAPELLEACIWAERSLAPFSKEPAEKSGISLLRAAITKATGAA